jgi:enoyl-CoA hydratase/carnithine racemase
MENSSFKIIQRGDVYVMTMLKGENRFNQEFLDHLNEALAFLEQTKGAGALVTTSSDAKYFSLGLEIACLAQGIEQATAYLEYYLKTLARLAVLPMPTVAAINGHCTAGGGFFALVHDFTIVTEGKALFFMNEIDLGLGFSEGMAKILKTKLTGHKLIRDVGILGKRYSLVEAVAAGIFDASVPAVNLLDRAISTAQLWAPKATKRRAMSLIKKEIHSELVAALHSKINPELFPSKAKL